MAKKKEIEKDVKNIEVEAAQEVPKKNIQLKIVYKCVENGWNEAKK